MYAAAFFALTFAVAVIAAPVQYPAPRYVSQPRNAAAVQAAYNRPVPLNRPYPVKTAAVQGAYNQPGFRGSQYNGLVRAQNWVQQQPQGFQGSGLVRAQNWVQPQPQGFQGSQYNGLVRAQNWEQQRPQGYQAPSHSGLARSQNWVPRPQGRNVAARIQGNGAIYGRPYSYNGNFVASVEDFIGTGYNQGTNVDQALVDAGSNTVTSVGERNNLNTGKNTVTLSVNGEAAHTFGTGPLSIGMGGEGGPNIIDSGNNYLEGNNSAFYTGDNTIQQKYTGNTANTGDNNLNVNIDEDTYRKGQQILGVLGGQTALTKVGNAVGGLLGSFGVTIAPNEGNNGGEGAGDNRINAGQNTVNGYNNTIYSGSNTIDTSHSGNTYNGGEHTLNLDFTGDASVSHDIDEITTTTGENTIDSSQNTVNGGNNVVQAGDNQIISENSGHTANGGDSTLNIGGAFKLVKNAFGWQIQLL